MTIEPFIKGSTAILQVAIELFRMSLTSKNSNDQSRYAKTAFILTDDAVELAAKTYVLQKMGENTGNDFPAIINQIENRRGITEEMSNNLKSYHKIRNKLYHEGWLFSIAEDGIRGYIELAITFFSEIFISELEHSLVNDPKRQFLFRYSEFVKLLSSLAKTNNIPVNEDSPIGDAIEKLLHQSVVSIRVRDVFNSALELSDKVIPTAPNLEGTDVSEPANEVQLCIDELKQILGL